MSLQTTTRVCAALALAFAGALAWSAPAAADPHRGHGRPHHGNHHQGWQYRPYHPGPVYFRPAYPPRPVYVLPPAVYYPYPVYVAPRPPIWVRPIGPGEAIGGIIGGVLGAELDHGRY